MIQVLIPADRCMIEKYERESPWATVEIFNPAIGGWLDARQPDWDWTSEGNWVTLYIRDLSVALLFKLTWGGR